MSSFSALDAHSVARLDKLAQAAEEQAERAIEIAWAARRLADEARTGNPQATSVPQVTSEENCENEPERWWKRRRYNRNRMEASDTGTTQQPSATEQRQSEVVQNLTASLLYRQLC